MFEQAFKNIGDVLWKDAGCTSELDYTEQTSWLLFLKYLDALEHDKATGPNTIEYKIGEIFGEIKNRIQSGYNLRQVWFYQFDPGRNMGKTNPFNDADLAEFIALQKTKADSPKNWSVDVAAIDPKTFDLSLRNPNGGEEIAHHSPQEIMDEIAALDAESADVLTVIRKLL